jgi:hypothetical protein
MGHCYLGGKYEKEDVKLGKLRKKKYEEKGKMEVKKANFFRGKMKQKSLCG